MISIPLELFIFKDYIAIKGDEQLNRAESIYRTNVPETKKINERIDEINTLISSTEREREKLQNSKDRSKGLVSSSIDLSSKLGNPETERYKNAISKVTDIEKKLGDTSISPNIKETLAKERDEFDIVVKDEVAKHDNAINAQIRYANKGLTLYDSDIDELKKSIKHNDSIKLEYSKKRDRLVFTRDSLVAVHIAKYKKSNQFINNYKILATAVQEPGSEYELLFLWLIRILFFVIEILPTLVKIISEPGNYDWIVFTRERNRRLLSDNIEFQEKELHNLLEKELIKNQIKMTVLEDEQIRKKREQSDRIKRTEVIEQIPEGFEEI